MKIEKIKPIMDKVPKKITNNPDGNSVTVEGWEEYQNGWDFGESDLIGKINEIIDWINRKDDQLL